MTIKQTNFKTVLRNAAFHIRYSYTSLKISKTENFFHACLLFVNLLYFCLYIIGTEPVNKKFPIIESLLSGDCDINTQNVKEYIPLHLAFSKCNPHNAIVLYKYGFDINSITEQYGSSIENLCKASSLDIRRFSFIYIKKLDALGLHIN